MSPEISSAIDSIEVSLSVGGMNVINTVLSFVMFGIALDIHPSVFIDVFKKPKGVLIGALCQFLLLPALTFLLAIALGDFISPMIALGMILVASCPGGNISNFISSISKTWRDEKMRELAASFPQYAWDRNMGYPTKEHIAAIREFGYTPHHRKSFHPKELEPTLF